MNLLSANMQFPSRISQRSSLYLHFSGYVVYHMAPGIELIKSLKDELGKRPVTLNVVFGFLLAGVEKMLEVDFACPCNPSWNAVFVVPFFLIPAATTFFLMLLIHGDSLQKKFSCTLPPIVWFALMFLDGQYLVCATTNWHGIFIASDNTYLKWCEPVNVTVEFSKKLLHRSHRFYIVSQVRKITDFVLFCV